ncbi:MAG: nucleoside triphosphate pyrophosphohydrolase [Acidobacteriaceae bacterium]
MTPTKNRSSNPDISAASEVSSSQSTSLETSFARAVTIMAQLRAPGGCPWDREQTFDSIRRYTLEETYEVLDAIERKDWIGLKDELGDLLLQVLFYAEMAQEAKLFTLQDVADNLSEKLIRRHPHVFGNREGVETSAQVLQNWEEIKKSERADAPNVREASLLDQVPRSLPALMEASKLGSKAASIGFDWSEAAPVFDKLQEEIQELRQAIISGERKAQEEELGDLLFTVVNLARKLGMQSEFALRASNAKFRRRFASMESSASAAQSLAELGSEELEKLWDRAKTDERKGSASEQSG